VGYCHGDVQGEEETTGMINLYVFRNKWHYSDYMTKLYCGDRWLDDDKKPVVIEKPKCFTVNVLDIDFDAVKALLKSSWGLSYANCPLCAWNDTGLAWLKPYFEEREKKPNIVREKWTICPCKIYNLDYISFAEKRGTRHLKWENLDFFKSLNIDWKEWLRNLQNNDVMGRSPLVFSGGDGGNNGRKELTEAF
jgi:hypothetical protein